MDYTGAALSFGLLLIPLAFASVLIGQGILKVKKKEHDGKAALILGAVLLVSIPLLYVFIVNV